MRLGGLGRRDCGTAAWAALLLMISAAQGRGQRPEPPIEHYLRDSIGITPRELSDVQRGSVLAKILPTQNPRDVTVFGMVQIATTRAAFTPRLADSRRIIGLRSPIYEVFDEPPTGANLERVSVDSSEYRDLRNCRLEHCSFKLPAATMSAFATAVSWASDSAKAQADSLVRANLLRFVSDYRVAGNAAMVEYDDNHAVKSSDAFLALLDQSEYLRDFVPDLRDYLEFYPTHRPEGVRDVLFWEENRLPHLRPTLTLSHMVTYTTMSGTPLVAIKQIYADHYFEGGLELLAAFDAPPTARGPAMYLISVRHYRFDALPSGGFLNLRGRVRGRLADAVRSDLERERQDVEGAGGGSRKGSSPLPQH
jgi:hypothetical protein